MDPKSRIAKKFVSTIDVVEKKVEIRGNPPILPVVKKVG